MTKNEALQDLSDHIFVDGTKLSIRTGYVYRNRRGDRVLIEHGWLAEGTQDVIAFIDTATISYAPDGKAKDLPRDLDLVEELFECHGRDTPERINFYESDYYCFSSFSSFCLFWKDRRFDTLEAAYHYEKFNAIGYVDPTPETLKKAAIIRGMIFRAKSAHDAFTIARAHDEQKRPDWDQKEAKVRTMFELIVAKTRQHEYVLKKVLNTHGRRLSEDSWRDGFWGSGPDDMGLDVLGQLWELVRTIAEAGQLNDIDPKTYPLDSIVTEHKREISEVAINSITQEYLLKSKPENISTVGEWTQPSPPNESCPYDHVKLDTPLGQARITWRSWKQHDNFCLGLDGEYLETGNSIDELKLQLEIILKQKFDELRSFLYGRKEGMIKAPLPAGVEDTPEIRRKVQNALIESQVQSDNVSVAFVDVGRMPVGGTQHE